MHPTRLSAAVAALALTASLAGTLAGTASAAANPQAQPVPPGQGRSLALAAADKAADSGLDGLRHGTDEELVRTAVTPWAGGLYYAAYQRTYKGLPVAGGGDAVVLTDSAGKVRHVAAAPAPALKLSTKATVGSAAALATARAQLAGVESASAPELSVLLKGNKPVLAWHTLVVGRTAKGLPSSLDTYVDARTGKVAQATDKVLHADGRGYHNGNVTIDTATTSMTDATRSPFRCGGQNGSAYTGSSPWGNGSANDLVTACVDIMYAAQRESDMLKQWFGYNGQNGQGGMVPARAGLSEVNAYYDGTKTTFGHNQNGTMQLTGIDVVAHEYGHEIFDKTPGSAGSSNENGGMNESTGDIFGALTEHFANNPNDTPDYTVGEKLNFLGDNKPIRYMYNPSLAGDPNCYPQLNSGTEVHAAAGPQNHWFYLLAEGSNPGGGKPASPICSGGPSSVTGIGVQKAGKIFMGALLMKTSSWNHLAARRATLATAKNTYGSAECNAVKTAWNAIGVPAQSGETDCGGTTNPDFSLALNPAAGTVQAGGSVNSTVGTTTTGGSAQTVQLSASGVPSGVKVSFSPTSVTSGDSSTMTVQVAADTANGTYPITVTGTGSATHTVTYQLTVGTDTPPPTGCDNSEYTYQGSLASGQAEVQPDGSYYYSATSGTHVGCLRGPAGTDFDLYLQKWNGYNWADVAVGGTAGADEDTSYYGSAGYYRYVVHAYSGSGAYTLGLSAP
ncbi:M4 family metallopeptidase [Streptomyces sp. SKN60]|uniref:M4 family metallopeptidase n=1 Tax=Streptomyces sp. SKN60 TaxID=2855506 RepID=UPI002247231C|nr:M4 family metallopeptidase [Streptomyces sp. SKN60]MCX2179676.1 M4 family metallopeptidase [Streptomyces sp. SKN60]